MNRTNSNRTNSRQLGKLLLASLALLSTLTPVISAAQDQIPPDNGIATYHTSPRYRESESHPLRLVAYILHPIGWVAREVIFRPLSYFASSTEVTRSVMGFREPYDYRQPECFSADDSTPDCRAVLPFNYDNISGSTAGTTGAVVTEQPAMVSMNSERQVYVPDVAFEFNSSKLTDLGEGRVHQIAKMLESQPGLKVVLQGHADFVGAPEFNERLGLARAETVREGLVALGLSADRLSTVTFGESQPVFTDETKWARAVNRRVEVSVGGEEASLAQPEVVVGTESAAPKGKASWDVAN